MAKVRTGGVKQNNSNNKLRGIIMTTRQMMYCDCCGKQMTVIDSDGDLVHEGIKFEPYFSVRETKKTDTGSSLRPILDMHKTDFCSYKCVAVAMKSLLVNLYGEMT